MQFNFPVKQMDFHVDYNYSAECVSVDESAHSLAHKSIFLHAISHPVTEVITTCLNNCFCLFKS